MATRAGFHGSSRSAGRPWVQVISNCWNCAKNNIPCEQTADQRVVVETLTTKWQIGLWNQHIFTLHFVMLYRRHRRTSVQPIKPELLKVGHLPLRINTPQNICPQRQSSPHMRPSIVYICLVWKSEGLSIKDVRTGGEGLSQLRTRRRMVWLYADVRIRTARAAKLWFCQFRTPAFDISIR